MKKKILVAFVFSLLLCTLFALGISAKEAPAPVYSSKCQVFNIENNKVCYSNNDKKTNAPAGTVKIMTVCLALEHFEGKLDTPITVKGEWVKDITGVTIGYVDGETVTANDIIAGLIVGGGNDSAYVIANAVAGSTDAFVEMMNNKAAELGMTNTKYKNPSGADENGMKTTAEDVVKLCVYASKFSKYTEYSSQRSVALETTNKHDARTIYNRNYFVANFYNQNYVDHSVIGLNAGQSTEGGWCLAIIGRNDAGLTYVVVVLGGDNSTITDPNIVGAYEDASALLHWAYEEFTFFTILDTSEMVCEVPVRMSDKADHVILLPEEKVVAYLPADTDIENRVTTEWKLNKKVLNAPLSQYEPVGTLSVLLDGEVQGTVNLVPKNNVDRSNLLYVWSIVWGFISQPIVVAVIGIIIVGSLYIALRRARVSYKKRHKVRYKHF